MEESSLSSRTKPSADIPRLLLNRDPRNEAHLQAVRDLFETIGHFSATQRTIDELALLGLRPFKKTKVWKKRLGKHDAVVGAFFFLDRGVHYPDNVIATCRDCKAPLQLRPETAASRAPKLCLFCTADELLKEHWSKDQERR